MFFNWLDKLLELSPSEPSQYYKTVEQRRKQVLPWMKALIKNEAPSESFTNQIQTGARPSFFNLGNFNEWRATLALTILKAKSSIKDFAFPKTHSANDSLGIDVVAQLKSSQGKNRYLPMQIKSSNTGAHRVIHFLMSENFFQKMRVAPKEVVEYLRQNNNRGRMRRLIPSFKVRTLSLIEIAEKMKKSIRSYGRKKIILKTEGEFDDKSRHEKIGELVQSGFFKNLSREEQHQSLQSPPRQC